jgi:hypothetical protein
MLYSDRIGLIHPAQRNPAATFLPCKSYASGDALPSFSEPHHGIIKGEDT